MVTPHVMHSEAYDAFQDSRAIGHGPPWDGTAEAFAGRLRTAIDAQLAANVSAPNRAWSAACFKHCVTMSDDFFDVKESSSQTSLAEAFREWFVEGNATSAIDACSGVNCSPGCT